MACMSWILLRVELSQKYFSGLSRTKIQVIYIFSKVTSFNSRKIKLLRFSSQVEHLLLYGFFASWTELICYIKLPFSEEAKLQFEHSCGFVFHMQIYFRKTFVVKWTIMGLLSLMDSVNVFSSYMHGLFFL